MLPGQIAFYVLAVVTIGAGIGVIAFRNAVYSALSLILNIGCLALFYLMLNGLFIATVQVLIYAGAIMVLFLFVVTTLTPNNDALNTRDRMVWQRAAAIGLGVILVGAFGYILLAQASISPDAMTTGAQDLITQIGPDGKNTEAFGEALFHGFLFPFEVTSVILIAAILGAVVLGRRTSSREEE